MPEPIITPAGLEAPFDLSTYYPILIYSVIVIGFSVVTLFGSWLISPGKRTAVKMMPYESGMDPIGDARQRFDVKFYLIAILFLVFDVELLFLYPWAVVAYREGADALWKAEFGRLVFCEILVFFASLAVAYVYAWRKGVFAWR
ncbi:MAG: NADH-quinone oxidoreductase subunit A [Gemmataceae bacterium]|nr:NADH-quinone oxidoreductase subunit A [Gemmataceae bacterium]